MVTIADVAGCARVSSSTASHELDGKRTISEETRRGVHRSAAAPGHHPGAGARTPAGRRSDLELDDQRIPALRAEGTQAMRVGLPDDPSGLSCVDHDFAAARALCVDHLADLGHRDVAFVGYGPGVPERLAGRTEGTPAGFGERSGQRGTSFLQRACDGTYDGTAGTPARVLADRPETTGFVVQNEEVIGPLLNRLGADGGSAPEGASVVGLCPEQPAGQHALALTAVRGPAQELGRVAVEQSMSRLGAVMRGGAAGGRTSPSPAALTVRRSRRPAVAESLLSKDQS
ncbi:substrate-binding domain-containing protein [Streptomyces sp. Ru72]|uniref:substrate-binding domain-containing protein n=1 Tax=Streptomyces sp. Ru72 TaxID=2080747 RepID=UPI000CDD7BFD|nr:substrate-binding domain-containing protein [Streptomyces sp. Ru72]POX45830.1 LacI family transcriptional regulator [Streptomyces sp. Ru72]